MEHDYYQILGVSPDATFSILKAAYRKQALRCHPDRGGTNAEMMLLNEAWEVLSNAGTRREYDDLRAMRGGTSEQTAFEETVKTARTNAGQYPREWAAFESWLNGISQDFANAEYGTERFGGIDVATATKSISGWLFAFVGGIVGGGLAIFIMASLGIDIKLPNTLSGFLSIKAKIGFFVFVYGLGTHLGIKIHKSLRSMLPHNSHQQSDGFQASKQPQRESPVIVVICPQCGQKLRVPSDKGALTVTCKKCQNKFSASAAVPGHVPSSETGLFEAVRDAIGVSDRHLKSYLYTWLAFVVAVFYEYGDRKNVSVGLLSVLVFWSWILFLEWKENQAYRKR